MWLVAIAAIGGIALYVGVQPSSLLTIQGDGTLNPWLVLLFATSLSVFGFYHYLAPPGASSRFVRGRAWIFAIGGLLLILRSVAELLGWLH